MVDLLVLWVLYFWIGNVLYFDFVWVEIDYIMIVRYMCFFFVVVGINVWCLWLCGFVLESCLLCDRVGECW